MQALTEAASRLPPFTAPKFASGGAFAAGQEMWVGERGPDLVSFSGNGQVYSHGVTPAASQGNVINQITRPRVVYQNPQRSKADAAEHTRTFADEFDQRIHAHLLRRKGLRKGRLDQLHLARERLQDVNPAEVTRYSRLESGPMKSGGTVKRRRSLTSQISASP